MKNTALFHSMAFLATVALVSLLLVGCASDGSLTPQGQKGVTTALQIAQIALSNYATIESAKSAGGKLTNAQVATLASNDLSGLAALAQANVGSTPAAANLAQGAANPSVGNAVVSALPNAPMTQGTVNTLYSAATQASAR
ncbi:hypothetical protein CfE428DRAFT_5528 [Chthoniobacter flavus Ellin428]|uniref:Lipoprotein n=1 Tax=Chthoniobacter flavus Ellin428 TaxID=497964 RepID=B4D9D8_9BACT|nr:hypothetical protein [Chthoniobacter flavus]EDY16899.1 hypothetical protein CfE428DRAFT_5528 [Chthoniobacter flavus Ellin428]TCO87781.1 hypothetical protein EV701_12080 [Chthoniobacter flavus]